MIRWAPSTFSGWMSWAKKLGIGLDFNETYFSHPMAESGFTLSSRDKKVRDFWVNHSLRCREIGEAMGKALGTPCIIDLWIARTATRTARGPPHAAPAPEGVPGPGSSNKHRDPRYVEDAVEGKLFGIGSESYVVGSHEFYLAYALQTT